MPQPHRKMIQLVFSKMVYNVQPEFTTTSIIDKTYILIIFLLTQRIMNTNKLHDNKPILGHYKLKNELTY